MKTLFYAVLGLLLFPIVIVWLIIEFLSEFAKCVMGDDK